MSQENVELVRRSYELFNRRDVQGWLATLSEDVELDERYLAPDAAVYRGREGARRWLLTSAEAIGTTRVEVLRWFHGGDAVVTEVAVHVRGTASGAEATARLAHAIRIRDRKGVYVASFPTVAEALAAVRLRE
jgi:ketosteroid isomerase-like protein